MPTSQFLRPFILQGVNEDNFLHGMFMHRELEQIEPRLNVVCGRFLLERYGT